MCASIQAWECALGTEWGMEMAAGSLMLLPIIAFAFLVQRHITRGMTLGAVKGWNHSVESRLKVRITVGRTLGVEEAPSY